MTAIELLEELERQIVKWGYINANTTLLMKIKDAIKELENRACKNCNWYAEEVCCNGGSPLCADFVPEDYGCILFKEK